MRPIEEVLLNFTPEQRANIVANYVASGLSQRAFCADAKLSARTLRSWMRRHAPRPEPVAEAIAEIDIILTAVEGIRARLARWHAVPSQDSSALAAGSGAPLATMPLSASVETTSASSAQAVQPPQAAVALGTIPSSTTTSRSVVAPTQQPPQGTSVGTSTAAPEALAEQLPDGLPPGEPADTPEGGRFWDFA